MAQTRLAARKEPREAKSCTAGAEALPPALLRVLGVELSVLAS